MIFDLPYPPLLNATYKMGSGNFYKSKKAKDWEEEAGWVLKQIWKDKPWENPVSISLIIYYKREPDIDAPIKIVLDLLQRQRVIINDRQIQYLSVQKIKDVDWPRVEIQIEKI